MKKLHLDGAVTKALMSFVAAAAAVHFALGIDVWASQSIAEIAGLTVVVTVVACSVMS